MLDFIYILNLQLVEMKLFCCSRKYHMPNEQRVQAHTQTEQSHHPTVESRIVLESHLKLLVSSNNHTPIISFI